MKSFLKKIFIGLIGLVITIVVIITIRFNTLPVVPFDLNQYQQVLPDATVGEEQVESNKQWVKTIYDRVFIKAGLSELDGVLAENFAVWRQTIKGDKNNLTQYLSERRVAYPQRSATIHRVIAQGNLVFLHVEETLDTSTKFARGELFKVNQGKITELCSVEQLVPSQTASGSSLFDGENVDTRKDYGKKFLEKTLRASHDTFMNSDLAAVDNSTTDRYIQHNPQGQIRKWSLC